MIIKSLSKHKIQLEHRVPIYVSGFDNPVSHIDIEIRYKKDKDYRNSYYLIKKSVDKYTEKLAFKWKIGNIRYNLNSSYTISGITPHFLPKNINGDSLSNVVQFFMIDDQTFVSKMRNKKLNDILGEII
jgi:hypothetical protein